MNGKAMPLGGANIREDRSSFLRQWHGSPGLGVQEGRRAPGKQKARSSRSELEAQCQGQQGLFSHCLWANKLIKGHRREIR